MKIVIVGDGKVGSTLAERLSQEKHDIVVIDNDADALRATAEQNDLIGLVGNGATYSVQIEAGVEKADVVIAATSSDERNILCALIARKLGAKHTIARVRTPDYYSQMKYLKEDLGLSMYINPEYAAAGEMSRIIRCPSSVKTSPFAKGRAELTTFLLTEGNLLVGMNLSEIRNKLNVEILICAIQRKDEIIVPDGDVILQKGDKVTVVGAPVQVNSFFQKVKLTSNKVKNVMIAGGGRIAYYLSKQLLAMNINVTIIDNNPEKCRELCALLPEAIILNGDASDREFLIDEGIDNTDAFVSLTGMDEQNIMLSLYAKAHNISCVITKVNGVDFHAMLEAIGLDAVIAPKLITADSIVSYIRAMQNSEGSAMESMYKLLDGKIEALDFHVTAELPYLGVPLKSIKLLKQTLIAGIVRNGVALIPDGDTTIEKGDNVIVFSAVGGINRLSDIIVERVNK